MKVLFLDFDGVLHLTSDPSEVPFNRVPLLESLANEARFEIVVSSSWRFSYDLNQIRSLLGKLAPMVVGVTGKPVFARHPRYNEILNYVNEHNIRDWRVLDDALLEFPKNAPELILCNPSRGLTEIEVGALRGWLLSIN
jgi:hypothetical protein